jgi:hypothetical protein
MEIKMTQFEVKYSNHEHWETISEKIVMERLFKSRTLGKHLRENCHAKITGYIFIGDTGYFGDDERQICIHSPWYLPHEVG